MSAFTAAVRIADDIETRDEISFAWKQIDAATRRAIVDRWAEIIRETVTRPLTERGDTGR